MWQGGVGWQERGVHVPWAMDSVQWVSSPQVLRSIVIYTAVANNAFGSKCLQTICLGYFFFLISR